MRPPHPPGRRAQVQALSSTPVSIPVPQRDTYVPKHRSEPTRRPRTVSPRKAFRTTAVISGGHAQNGSQVRTAAVNLAHADLDQARSLVYPTYPAAVAAHSVTVGSFTFSVARTVTALYGTQAAAPAGQTCPTNLSATSVLSLKVTTTVSWTDRGRTQSTAMSTVIAC